MLADTSNCKVQKKDPTNGIQKKSNNLVKQLYEEKNIDNRFKISFTTHNSVALEIPGGPKVSLLICTYHDSEVYHFNSCKRSIEKTHR